MQMNFSYSLSPLHSHECMHRNTHEHTHTHTHTHTSIHAMEYYLAIKRNEILPSVRTWMGLEGIMLSEISQTGKDKYHMFLLKCGI